MTQHSDEEAFDSLLEERQPGHVAVDRSFLRSVRKVGLVSALLVVGFAVAWWGSSGAFARKRLTVTAPKTSFEQKESIGTVAVDPLVSQQRDEERPRMLVEQDLKVLLHVHTSQRQAHFRPPATKHGAALCHQQAERLFDDLATESALDAELAATELQAFRGRFASAMRGRCKDIISERLWLHAAGEELEQQKPVMSAAVAASINGAGLGFQAKMHDWLLHESVGSFDHHLGLMPTPEGSKDVLQRGPPKRQTEALPEVFRAELKWPACREEILKIHNQGHCGSCWAFGGLASIDARMCIASNATWSGAKDMLSRLHVTSCGPDKYVQGHDGCQGGWPHWPMEMMAERGIASSSCLPYYIGGEGAEHFQHQDTAPPCERHCQGGYSIPISDDTFSSAGVAKYDWLKHVHGDPTKMDIVKNAIYQEGPVAFAFKANYAFMAYAGGVFSSCSGHDQANHAVYAFGWGLAADASGEGSVEYVEASNSWGTRWGLDGHFRIHPRCVTDVTIPGSIESTVVNHQVGIVDLDVPRDPDNAKWPWDIPPECPFKDGCITDSEGSRNYSHNEKCVSDALNGKKIRVVEFDMEYGYDVLYVNGKKFTGNTAYGVDLDTLNGMVVDEKGIKFTSDFSENSVGFKLCEDV